MYAVRIHGRGGQGVVTAAELLSVAAFAEGREAQAFPSFGSERMGAPVVAFCRIDDREIRLREPIVEPDAIVVQDATLVHQAAVFEGLGPGGNVLVNSTRALAELGLAELAERCRPGRALTIPAGEIAREELGRPLPGTALLGALAALTGVVSLDALAEAIAERFDGETARANGAAARRGHDHVLTGLREVTHA